MMSAPWLMLCLGKLQVEVSNRSPGSYRGLELSGEA